MKLLPLPCGLLAMSPILLTCSFPLPASAADDAEVTPDRVMALAKTYFRDSAEVPMDVAVITVVTDKSGKMKRSAQSGVRMIFRGYGLQTRSFNLNGRSGWFNTGALRDSMSGNMAAFAAPLFLMPGKDGAWKFDLRQPSRPGEPILAVNRAEPCQPFELMPPRGGKYLYPWHPCGAMQFTVAVKPSNEPVFERYAFDAAGLPVPVKVAYLGDAQLLAFHVDIEFQEGFLPGESKPFLWPKETVTSAATDKGKITITNRYSPRAQGKR